MLSGNRVGDTFVARRSQAELSATTGDLHAFFFPRNLAICLVIQKATQTILHQRNARQARLRCKEARSQRQIELESVFAHIAHLKWVMQSASINQSLSTSRSALEMLGPTGRSALTPSLDSKTVYQARVPARRLRPMVRKCLRQDWPPSR